MSPQYDDLKNINLLATTVLAVHTSLSRMLLSLLLLMSYLRFRFLFLLSSLLLLMLCLRLFPSYSS